MKIKTVANKENKIALLDLNTMKKQYFEVPEEIPCALWWSCVKIVELTENQLIIEYMTKSDKKVKKYIRY